MTSVQPTGNPPQSLAQSPTLRQLLDRQRQAAAPLQLARAVELIVPFCVEIANLHAKGCTFHLHPSNIAAHPEGRLVLVPELASTPPSLPADQACLPPEASPKKLGDARTSVYSIGAIFYELLTNLHAGAGMKRPSSVVADIPASVEGVLAKALIADPLYRPNDLYALAQAIFVSAPQPNIPAPPSADASHLDQVGDLDVDVSLSMLPPTPEEHAQRMAATKATGLDMAVRDATVDREAPTDQATAELAALKARLERDPAPRYVVIKDGMDHGPFTAVELLQQLGSHTFVLEDTLQDTQLGVEKLIEEFDEFAPFAEHAERHRQFSAERKAVEHSVAQESKNTRGKATVGFAVLGLLLLSAVLWFVAQRGTRSDEVAVQTETVSNIEAEGAVQVKRKKGKGRRTVGKKGGVPQLSGGMSCRGAQNAYVEEIKMGGGQADITRGQYARIMNDGAYFAHCNVPSNVAVSICAAVQNGRAVGVTVSTKPKHPSRSCVSSAVRRKRFPTHPKLDVVRVSFAAQ